MCRPRAADKFFVKETREVLRGLRVLYPDHVLMWRSTPPGHPKCHRRNRPLRAPLDPAALPHPFSWDKFAAQNDLARALVEEVGGIYLDVAYATSLRPDGHFWHLDGTPDCLHYCSPGPVDHWVNLLYNALLHVPPPEPTPDGPPT